MRQSADAFRVPLLIAAVLAAAAVAGLWAAPQFDAIALAGVALVLVLALVFFKPVAGLYLAAFVIPIENLFVLGGGVTAARALVALALVAWAVSVAVHRRPWSWIFSGVVIKPAFLFVAFAAASLLWAEHYPAAIKDVITLGSLFLFTLLVIGVIDSWQRVEWLARSLVLGGLVGAGITVFQFFVLGFRRAGEGVSGGVNETGTTMVLLVPLAFYMFVNDRSPTWRLLGLAFIGTAVLTVALTVSRLSLMMLPIVLGLLIWEMLRSKRIGAAPLLATVLAIALVAFLVIPWDSVLERGSTVVSVAEGFADEDPATGENRVQHWRGAIAIFDDYPLLGAGIGNFGYQFLEYQFKVPAENNRVYVNFRSSHSTLLGILAELGIIGAALWVWLMGAGILSLTMSNRRSAQAGWWLPQLASRVLVYILVVYGLYSLFSVTHNHKLLWLVFGLAAVVSRLTALGLEEGQPETS